MRSRSPAVDAPLLSTREWLREIGALFKKAAIEWWNDDTFRFSASLAYYTIFAMAPLLLISVSIASVWFGEEAATRHLIDEVGGLVGAEAARTVRQMFEVAQRGEPTPLAAVVGLGVLLLGSTALFVELQAALNHVWDVKPALRGGMLRALARDRLQSFALVLGVGFVLLVSLVLSALLSAVQELLSGRMDSIPLIWRFASSIFITSVLFAMIYKVLPDVAIEWKDVVIGAVVTALLFTIGKYLIGVYIGRVSFGSRYGAAGSFVVLLVWVYYSALICFYGAEFTHVYARRRGRRIRPSIHAVRVGRKPA